MGLSGLLLFLPIFLRLVVLAIAQPPSPLAQVCSNSGNFTANSTYKSNLNHLLTTLSSEPENNYGFYNRSFGQKTDKVNSIALCRGDKNPDACRSCINNSTQVLLPGCPNQKEAIVWYDDCMLRYSNRSIFGRVEFSPSFFLVNINNVTKVTEFHQVLKTLLNNLTSQAASGSSVRKFAVGNTTTESAQSIYALVQCTPDLSKENCTDCLAALTEFVPKCCLGKQGGRVITPSCHLRYEKELFYDIETGEVAPSSAPSPSPVGLLLPSPGTTTTPPPPPASATSRTGEAIKVARIILACAFAMFTY